MREHYILYDFLKFLWAWMNGFWSRFWRYRLKNSTNLWHKECFNLSIMSTMSRKTFFFSFFIISKTMICKSIPKPFIWYLTSPIHRWIFILFHLSSWSVVVVLWVDRSDHRRWSISTLFSSFLELYSSLLLQLG